MKMPKTLMIASGKGGTGKTLCSINLSLALNYLDHKVILLDGNIKHPNIFHHFNLEIDKHIHDIHKHHPFDIITNHPSGLDIVFGSSNIDDHEKIDHTHLEKVIQFLKSNLKNHDFMIIDTAPNFSRDFFHCAKHADESIIVTRPTKSDIHDARYTIQYCDDHGASVIGMIVNLHGFNHKVNIDDIERELRKPVLGVVPHDRKVHKSMHIGHPVVCSYPNSKISKKFMELGMRYSDLNSEK
jgi:MinD-like ATPase involved in chromosome partitioning or flagellar assembly